MRALFMGDAASMAVLGFSPWVIPLIAVAAKLRYDQTRNVFRREFPQNRSSHEGNAGREGRPRDQNAMNERIRAKMGGK
jgi:hypothetical protein